LRVLVSGFNIDTVGEGAVPETPIFDPAVIPVRVPVPFTDHDTPLDAEGSAVRTVPLAPTATPTEEVPSPTNMFPFV